MPTLTARWASYPRRMCVTSNVRSPISSVRNERCRVTATAWNRRSSACHVHAFELQRSAAEVEHLCGVVASLVLA